MIELKEREMLEGEFSSVSRIPFDVFNTFVLFYLECSRKVHRESRDTGKFSVKFNMSMKASGNTHVVVFSSFRAWLLKL